MRSYPDPGVAMVVVVGYGGENVPGKVRKFCTASMERESMKLPGKENSGAYASPSLGRMCCPELGPGNPCSDLVSAPLER